MNEEANKAFASLDAGGRRKEEASHEAALQKRLEAWRQKGLARKQTTAAGKGPRLSVEGRELVSFASNDYLGLSGDPRVVAAATTALQATGAGATASRLLCGTRPEHAALEAALCDCKRSETALVFASGYQAAVASLVALAGGGNEAGGAGDADGASAAVVLDRLAHASLVDGARLSGAYLRTFRHNDPADLRRALQRVFTHLPGGRCLVVCESLYSMDGDEAPLANMLAVCREFAGPANNSGNKTGATTAAGASRVWLFVDEAHATGVLGPTGRGALEQLFPKRLPADVVVMGTLSKALGSQGGFLCGTAPVREAVLHFGRAYIFSTGLSPAAAAAARAALQIAQGDPSLRERLFDSAARLRGELTAAGFALLPGRGPILPVMVGDERRATAWARHLWEAGFWVPAIRRPTVPPKKARLRLSVSAAHTTEDLAALTAAFKKLPRR